MAKCYLYDITDPIPTSFAEIHWQQLFQQMAKSGWYGSRGRRVGFVNMARQNGMIGGYFANEGTKRGIQYNDNKEEVDPPPFYSFEHLFFVLFEDTAQLLLQSINVYGYVDLSFPDMRINFLRLLADLFRLARIRVAGHSVGITSAGATYSQEQLYSIFTGLAQVTELEITRLDETALPLPDDPRYELFNPRDEWHEITWGAIADTVRSGLDYVSMRARESVESTLQAPIPKALAAVGEIESIRGSDREGRIVFRRRTEDAELEIDLPVHPSMSMDILDRILTNLNSRGRAESWKERQQQRQKELDQGTLFEGVA